MDCFDCLLKRESFGAAGFFFTPEMVQEEHSECPSVQLSLLTSFRRNRTADLNCFEFLYVCNIVSCLCTSKGRSMCYTVIVNQPGDFFLQLCCNTIPTSNHYICPITAKATQFFISCSSSAQATVDNISYCFSFAV